MQDESDDKAWWSDLFHGSADPGSEVPTAVWDSAVGAALDPDAPSPDPDLVPSDDAESVDDLGDDRLADGDVGYPSHDSGDHDDVVAGDDAQIAHSSEDHVGFGDPEATDHI